jgi:uncharacterized protein YbjT (DUF2867 family)
LHAYAADPASSGFIMTGRQVLLLGATGLVGRHCLQMLLQDGGVAHVRALVRRPLEGVAPSPRLEVVVGDFEQMAAHPEWFAVDEVFCALGTTIAAAGSQSAFRRVDFDYPLIAAQSARRQGARHYLLVSALGANAQSFIFYNRVKGELENELRALQFPALTIAQPSMLMGERKERRWKEEWVKPLAWLWPAAYRPVKASQVALGLLRSAQHPPTGVATLSNRTLRAAT